jgi:hypothetical protein
MLPCEGEWCNFTHSSNGESGGQDKDMERITERRNGVKDEESKHVLPWNLTGSVLQLLVTAAVPSSLIISTLMTETIPSSETLGLARATRRHISENILHSHRRENLKSYIALTGCAL